MYRRVKSLPDISWRPSPSLTMLLSNRQTNSSYRKVSSYYWATAAPKKNYCESSPTKVQWRLWKPSNCYWRRSQSSVGWVLIIIYMLYVLSFLVAYSHFIDYYCINIVIYYRKIIDVLSTFIFYSEKLVKSS